MLQGGAGGQALHQAQLIACKARLAQPHQLLQPLQAPQALLAQV